MDATQRSLYSRLGGYRTAALYDGHAISAKARATYRESFLAGHACKLCPTFTMPEGLPEAEVARRAEASRRGHYTRLAIASSQSRSKRKAGRIASASR